MDYRLFVKWSVVGLVLGSCIVGCSKTSPLRKVFSISEVEEPPNQAFSSNVVTESTDAAAQARSADSIGGQNPVTDFLSLTNFLDSLSAEQMGSMSQELEEVSFQTGETIIQEGDTGDLLYIIKSGQVKVVKNQNGIDEIIALLEEGDYFGERALILDEPRAASCIAAQDTVCFSLSRENFNKLIESSPELKGQMLTQIEQYGDTEIIFRSELAYGDPEGCTFDLKVVTWKSEKIDDEVELKIKTAGGNFIAEYIAPRKLKGQKILMVNRNLWFIPASSSTANKPISISPRQRKQGGGAFAEIASMDFSSYYNFKRLPDEQVNGIDCFVYDFTAKSKSVTYEKVKYWVNKYITAPVQADFLSTEDSIRHWVTYETNNAVKRGGEYTPFVSKITIETQKPGEADQKSILYYSNVTLQKIFALEFSLEEMD